MKLTNEQRRTMIVQAALRIASESGIWAVTHGTVAKRCAAPTSARTVRRVIGDKEALWQATIDVDETGQVLKSAREMGWPTKTE